MITVEESAKFKINDLIAEENNPDTKLRLFIQGGGCAGFNYGFAFDTEQNEDDFEFFTGNAKLLVDSMSMQYLQGATVKYVENLMGSQFTIENPNAQTTCGCGSSFSV